METVIVKKTVNNQTVIQIINYHFNNKKKEVNIYLTTEENYFLEENNIIVYDKTNKQINGIFNLEVFRFIEIENNKKLIKRRNMNENRNS